MILKLFALLQRKHFANIEFEPRFRNTDRLEPDYLKYSDTSYCMAICRHIMFTINLICNITEVALILATYSVY